LRRQPRRGGRRPRLKGRIRSNPGQLGRIQQLQLLAVSGSGNFAGVKRIITVIFWSGGICAVGGLRDFGSNHLIYNESLLTQSGAIMIRSNTLPIASGFTLGPQKDVVTCWHVLEGARDLYHDTNLLFISGQGVNRLKLKYALPCYDLAVFSANPPISGVPFRAGILPG